MQLTKTKRFVGGLTLTGALALTGLVGFAQQPAGQVPGDKPARHGGHGGYEGHEGHEGHGGHGGMRGPRGGGPMGGRFFEQLNLTDAQQQQLQQIATRYHESAQAQWQQGRAERGARGARGFDPLSGGTFDEAAVRAAAQARANAQVEREVAHARMMYEMYNVLTPEQKTQLATMRQQHEQQRQERRARRGLQSPPPQQQ